MLSWLDIDYCCGDQAMDCTVALLKALQHAHGLGVLHRDIKPRNIGYDRMLGIWKLFDWDLAVMTGADRTRCVSDRFSPAGTDGYIAPELFEGAPYSTQSDIWGLGRAVQNKFRYNTDSALSEALQQMLHRDPEARPSVEMLLHTLVTGRLGNARGMKSAENGTHSKQWRSTELHRTQYHREVLAELTTQNLRIGAQ